MKKKIIPVALLFASLALASCGGNTPAASSAASTESATSQPAATSEPAASSTPATTSEEKKSDEHYDDSQAGDQSQEQQSQEASQETSQESDPYELLKKFNASLLSPAYAITYVGDYGENGKFPTFEYDYFGANGYLFTDVEYDFDAVEPMADLEVYGVGQIEGLGYWDYTREITEAGEVDITLGAQVTQTNNIPIGDFYIPGASLAYIDTVEEMEAIWKPSKTASNVYKLNIDADDFGNLINFIALEVAYTFGDYKYASLFDEFTDVRLAIEEDGKKGTLSYSYDFYGSIYEESIVFEAYDDATDDAWEAFVANPENIPGVPTAFEEEAILEELFDFVPPFPAGATEGLLSGFDQDEEGATYYEWSDLGIHEEGYRDYLESLVSVENGFEFVEANDLGGMVFTKCINEVVGIYVTAEVYFIAPDEENPLDLILNPQGYTLARFYFDLGPVEGLDNINAHIGLIKEGLDELNEVYIPEFIDDANNLDTAVLYDWTQDYNAEYHDIGIEEDLFAFAFEVDLQFVDTEAITAEDAAQNYANDIVFSMAQNYPDCEMDVDEDDPNTSIFTLEEGYTLYVEFEYALPEEDEPVDSLSAFFDGDSEEVGSDLVVDSEEEKPEPVFTGNVIFTFVKEMTYPLDREAINAKIGDVNERFYVEIPEISEEEDALIAAYKANLLAVRNYGDYYGDPEYAIYEQGMYEMDLDFENGEDCEAFLELYVADLIAAGYPLGVEEEETSAELALGKKFAFADAVEDSVVDSSEEYEPFAIRLEAENPEDLSLLTIQFKENDDGTVSGYVLFQFMNEALYDLQNKNNDAA